MTPQHQEGRQFTANVQGLCEASFRNVWLNTETDPKDVRKTQLKGNLKSWYTCTLADHAGVRQYDLDEGDNGVLGMMENHVTDAVENRWSIEFLVRTLRACSLRHGVELL